MNMRPALYPDSYPITPPWRCVNCNTMLGLDPALIVECPIDKCHAPPWVCCRRPDGHARVIPHDERIELAMQSGSLRCIMPVPMPT